jgi:hypothetical protein
MARAQLDAALSCSHELASILSGKACALGERWLPLRCSARA